ncbi:hypothetical protein GGR50DRAFT_706853 [Xylaria sp. CBS 124048]|nr:hypothetical protein GGR50DRAFT_706853 [Xylaria sp. CBS 124048]
MEHTINPAIIEMFGPPPPGVDISEKREAAVVSVAIIGTFCAALAIGLRMWVRRTQRVAIMLDDYLIAVSLIFVIGTLIVTMMGVKAGAGRRIWSLDPSDVASVFRLLFAYTFIYAACVSLTRLSILYFYYRIFERGSPWFRLSLYIASFSTVAYVITAYVGAVFLCRPIPFFWTQYDGGKGRCINTFAFYFYMTVVNTVLDICVLLIPIREISLLQMSREKKISLCAVMGLGGIVCIVSVVKIWAFFQFSVVVDVVFAQADTFLLSSAEPAFGIVSACLPILRPLYLKAKDKLSRRGSQDSEAALCAEPKPPHVRKPSSIHFGDTTWNSTMQSTLVPDENAPASKAKGSASLHERPQSEILVETKITQSSNDS